MAAPGCKGRGVASLLRISHTILQNDRQGAKIHRVSSVHLLRNHDKSSAILKRPSRSEEFPAFTSILFKMYDDVDHR